MLFREAICAYFELHMKHKYAEDLTAAAVGGCINHWASEGQETSRNSYPVLPHRHVNNCPVLPQRHVNNCSVLP
jgi:hypothetical protein